MQHSMRTSGERWLASSKIRSPRCLSLVLLALMLLLQRTDSFSLKHLSLYSSQRIVDFSTALQAGRTNEEGHPLHSCKSRRTILSQIASQALLLAACKPISASASAADDVQEMRALILEAQFQLETVPDMLKEEKWDSVRTLLMEAPLRDCWSKTTPILKAYADALGETPDGDELAALEGREELLQHLRFLDMAVYNNVFNPIATEGKTGASKALIDSYYNDPTREYEASKRAFDELLKLSK